MAKMFYTSDETQYILGLNQDQLKELTSENRLREFRDGGRVLYKADQVDAIASERNIDTTKKEITFFYSAMNSSGRETTGTVTATSAEEAVQKIRAKGLYPTKVSQKGKQKKASKKAEYFSASSPVSYSNSPNDDTVFDFDSVRDVAEKTKKIEPKQDAVYLKTDKTSEITKGKLLGVFCLGVIVGVILSWLSILAISQTMK